MELNEFLNQKVKTGQQGEFSTAEGKNGKVIVVTIGDKRFVIEKSLENFKQFEKWDGKSATVDIKKVGKFTKVKDYGILPLVQLRTTVEVEDENPHGKEPVKQQTQDDKTPNNDDDTVVY